MDAPFDLLIIGAGWFGLAAAKTALQIRPTTRLLILEASSSLGGTWSRERVYGGLRTHNALGTLELPGLAMTGENTTAEGYLVGEDVAEYLHAFARKFGLLERMRCDSRVQNIARDADGVAWTVGVEGGQPLKARKIIVATGLTSRPLLPEVDDEKAGIERFHSVELHRREQWLKRDEVESVVIYGGSKSAYDAVFMAAEMGKRVEWVIRSSGAGTPHQFPHKTLGVNTANLAPKRLMASLHPTVYNRHWWWSRFLHGSAVGNRIVRTWWKTVTRIGYKKHGLHSTDNGRKLIPEAGELGAFWAGSSTAGIISQPKFWPHIHTNPKVTVHRGDIVSIVGDRVALSTSTVLQASAVIYCTGWVRDSSPFSLSDALHLGLPVPLSQLPASEAARWASLDASADAAVLAAFPMLATAPHDASYVRTKTPPRLYRFTAPLGVEDHSIVFVGTMHTAGTGIVAAVQTLWALAYLEGRLPLPDAEQMRTEVALEGAWCRRRYSKLGQLVPNITFEYLPYVDALLGDLGLETRRKGGWREWIETYRPRDYEGIVDEWCAMQGLGAYMDKEKAIELAD